MKKSHSPDELRKVADAATIIMSKDPEAMWRVVKRLRTLARLKEARQVKREEGVRLQI